MSKCHFDVDKAEFLAFTVTTNGIEAINNVSLQESSTKTSLYAGRTVQCGSAWMNAVTECSLPLPHIKTV